MLYLIGTCGHSHRLRAESIFLFLSLTLQASRRSTREDRSTRRYDQRCASSDTRPGTTLRDEITTDFRSRSAEQATNGKLAFERLKPSVSTFCSGMMSFGPFAIGGSLSLQGVEKSPRPHSAMAAGSPRSFTYWVQRRTEFRHDVVRRHISAKWVIKLDSRLTRVFFPLCRLGGWPEYGPIVETPTRRFSRL